MRKISIYILLVGLFLTGCANQAYLKKIDNFTPINWGEIVVLPFAGDRQFADEATSLFTMQLLDQKDFVILEPSAIQDAIDKVVINKNSKGGITISEAQRIGQLTNIKAVFLGDVTSYNNGITMNGFVTVRLIDTDSGRIIAASHKPGGLLFGWSEHQAVTAAVERVAKDMLGVLKDMASKNQKL
jgi:hypothetical protein